MIKHILTDLDGTLLSMDQVVFGTAYFKTLAQFGTKFGIEPQTMLKGLKVSLEAMAQHDGTQTNEEAFWKSFIQVIGGKKDELMPEFETYYLEVFPKVVEETCGFKEDAPNIVRLLRSKNYPILLLTNPLFPRLATQARVKRAGLKIEDFEEITTYEDYHSCKPSIEYYKEVMDKFKLDPKECLMIGNDLYEDGVAEELGIQVYILTDELINREGRDLNKYEHGTSKELLKYLEKFPALD